MPRKKSTHRSWETLATQVFIPEKRPVVDVHVHHFRWSFLSIDPSPNQPKGQQFV